MEKWAKLEQYLLQCKKELISEKEELYPKRMTDDEVFFQYILATCKLTQIEEILTYIKKQEKKQELDIPALE